MTNLLILEVDRTLTSLPLTGEQPSNLKSLVKPLRSGQNLNFFLRYTDPEVDMICGRDRR